MAKRECLKGWLGTYLDYTSGQESPSLFHTWTAISSIASALRRQVWIDRGYYTLYPNLFIILVSPSGVGNKTTCMKIGTELILAKALPDLDIMRGALTIPYLADRMTAIEAKHPLKEAPITIFAEEFKVFSKGLYADSGLVENLTKLFDCGTFEYLTKGKGQITINKPCVNMIAGSTPEWLTTGSADDFIGGGFSSRILPITITQREKRIAWPTKSVLASDLEQKLIRDLAQIGTLKGSFFITKEAKDFFATWYEVSDKKRKADRRLDGFYAKKADMVLKVAMSISISANDDLVLLPEHIQTSMKLIEKLEDTIAFAYQGVSWNPKLKYRDKVLAKIKDNSPMIHTDLLQAFKFEMTGNDLREVLKDLFEAGDIEALQLKCSLTGRPRQAYRIKCEIREGEKK